MIIEGLGNVTFVNGILRIQTLEVGSSGEISESGTIQIPGNMVGEVIKNLSAAAQGISDKLTTSENTEKTNTSDKKDSKAPKKGKK
tara:strand:+ start:6303 stop:6560 length:258 start_codon:yes stop_codon:yes gene_type:complete